MPFGIRSAPEVWQRKKNELIENLRVVGVIADDFLVCDFEILKRKLSRITDSNLAAFLRRARQEFKAKFNENEARLTEVPFIGHVLTAEGVKIDPRKVEAVARASERINVLYWHGPVPFKFLPRLSDVMEPVFQNFHFKAYNF